MQKDNIYTDDELTALGFGQNSAIEQAKDSIVKSLQDVVPVGGVENMQAAGETEDFPGIPLEAIKIAKAPKRASELDRIEIHKDFNDWLDEKLGPQYPEKIGHQCTGRWFRKGEGKFMKRLLRYHDKQVKRTFRVRGVKSVPEDQVYIFGFVHKKDNAHLATIQTAGLGSLDTVRIVTNEVAGEEIQFLITQINDIISQGLISPKEFVLVTDWNVVNNDE